jgi:hypothetical protein
MKLWKIAASIGLFVLAACAAPGTANRQPETATTPAPVDGPTPVETSLPRTSLLFEIDSRVWREQELRPATNTGVVAMRVFFRSKASTETECPAGMIIIAESVPPDIGVVEYSVKKRMTLPRHEVDRMFAHEDGMIQLQNAVGFRLRGTEGCHPVVHAVYARHGQNGFAIVIEVDPRDYTLIESEVRAILKSFRFADSG